MDKRTKERLEREKLKNMIENAPKLKAFLEAGVEYTPEDKSLADMIKPCIEDMLDKERSRALITGFRTCLIKLPEKLKKFESLEAAVEFFEEEAQKSREMLGVKEEADG